MVYLFRLVAIAGLLLLLAACGGREQLDGPGGSLDGRTIAVPEPRPEPLARYGNHSPYTVLGRTYHVLPSAVGYVERGDASWYGSKFHGRLTSSGEPFDMYEVSAAHKTLPLPTWVEVTNLRNGRTLVIRVNDRGPFKQGRIIDLSYAAAYKLDVLNDGTAPVEVRAITFDGHTPQTGIRPRSVPVELQVGAFSDRSRARAVRAQLEDAGIRRVDVDRARSGGNTVWRVRVGPIRDRDRATDVVQRLIDLGFGKPMFIYR
ncbi:MAG: septal ring lytic transglycosylase RlpA family protein [Pseudomonadota bacterium]